MTAPTEPPGSAARRPRRRIARGRARLEDGRARVERARTDLHALRGRNRMVDIGFRTWERDTRVGGGVLAAALAFRVFLFLIPFVFVAVTLVPLSAEAAGTTPQDLADRFGIAGLVGRAIRNASGMHPTARLWLLLGTTVALALATRSLLRVLHLVHALAWHIPLDRITKPRVVRDSVITIFGVTGILLLGALAAGLRRDLGLLGILPVTLDWAIVGVLWFLVELSLPHDGGRWRDLVPGAVLFAVGAWGLQIVTVVWYSRVLANKSAAFGAVGAALTILAWAYLLGRVVVTGANLNAALVDRRTGEGSAPAGPGEDDPA